MSTETLVTMLVVISIVSALVVALVSAIALAILRFEQARLHDESFVYSLGVAGDASHLEHRLRGLPWVVNVNTIRGPVDVFGRLTTTLFIRVTDPRKSEQELPRIVVDDGGIVVTAFRQGTHDWGETFMPSPQVGSGHESVSRLGHRGRYGTRLTAEPQAPAEIAVQVESQQATSVPMV